MKTLRRASCILYTICVWTDCSSPATVCRRLLCSCVLQKCLETCQDYKDTELDDDGNRKFSEGPIEYFAVQYGHGCLCGRNFGGSFKGLEVIDRQGEPNAPECCQVGDPFYAEPCLGNEAIGCGSQEYMVHYRFFSNTSICGPSPGC